MKKTKPLFWNLGLNPITMLRDEPLLNYSSYGHNKSGVSYDKQITEYRKERYNKYKN
jgi:hypothetical protein